MGILQPSEQKRLDKRLVAFKKFQEEHREDWIKSNDLAKEGDAHWRKYVDKRMKWRAKYDKVEMRRYRNMLIRELLNRRKNKVCKFIKI